MSEGKESAAGLGRFRPYPEYKGTSFDWLGDVPAEWKVSKFSWLISESNAGEVIDRGYWDDGDELLYSCQRTPMISSFGQFPDDRRTQPEDILVTRNGTPYVHLPEPGSIYTNVVQRIRPTSSTHRRFLWYSLSQAARSLKGFGDIIESFNMGTWRALGLGIPSYTEQRAIAEFLDRETGKIDALVAKKERLIELLQEKRTALITHAVTKGLDPTAPTKPSGIPWLGNIPAHWEVVRIKNTLFDRIAGPFGSSLTKDSYGGSTYRVYGQEQVIPARFDIGDYYIPESKYLEMQRFRVKDGDVLLSCVGTFGRAAVVPDNIEPGIINPRLILLRPDRRRVAPPYLELFLRSGLAFCQMDQLSRGGTMDIINLSLVSALRLPLPPQSGEQQSIVDFCETAGEKIDALVGKVEGAIERLKEFRTALISAAVTGKIDVREEVA